MTHKWTYLWCNDLFLSKEKSSCSKADSFALIWPDSNPSGFWFLASSLLTMTLIISLDLMFLSSWLSLLAFLKDNGLYLHQKLFRGPTVWWHPQNVFPWFNRLAKQLSGLACSKDSSNQRKHWNMGPFIKALLEALNYVKLFSLIAFNYSWRDRICKSKQILEALRETSL